MPGPFAPNFGDAIVVFLVVVAVCLSLMAVCSGIAISLVTRLMIRHYGRRAAWVIGWTIISIIGGAMVWATIYLEIKHGPIHPLIALFGICAGPLLVICGATGAITALIVRLQAA